MWWLFLYFVFCIYLFKKNKLYLFEFDWFFMDDGLDFNYFPDLDDFQKGAHHTLS